MAGHTLRHCTEFSRDLERFEMLCPVHLKLELIFCNLDVLSAQRRKRCFQPYTDQQAGKAERVCLDRYLDIVNPADESIYGKSAAGTKEDIDAAGSIPRVVYVMSCTDTFYAATSCSSKEGE